NFWTNSTTELLASTSEKDRQARTRNRCHGEGYESVALIGLSLGDERLGLLQLNDRRKDRFTPDSIGLWEGLADYLAVALAKLNADEELQKSEARLRKFYESGLVGVIYWNMDGIITDANDKFLEMVGYSREDLVAGRIDWVTMTPPEYRDLDEDSMRELKSTGVNK